MIKLKASGSFYKTQLFFNNARKKDFIQILEKYGQEGVEALKAATPKDTGKTAESWGYEVTSKLGGAVLTFTNSNIVDGVPIAIILQYGHGTGYGTYVQGRDYINPAIQPIFDKIAEDAWKEVTNL